MQSGPHKVAERKVWENEGKKDTISPKGFDITWGNDDRYWSIIDDGTKNACAELKQVSWLEVTCSTDKVEVGKYKVGFNVSLRPDAFGWNGIDVYVMAKVGKSGKFKSKKVSLGNKEAGKDITIPDEEGPLQIEVTQSSAEIYFGLYEVWSKKWKGGLKIYKAFIEKVADTDRKNGNPSKSHSK